MIGGFGVVIFLTTFAVTTHISKTESVRSHTDSVLQNEIPHLVHLMDLDSQVHRTVNNLNQYLITGDFVDLLEFRQSMVTLKDLINLQSSLDHADYKTTSLMKVMFHKYRNEADKVIRVSEDHEQNFQGIAEASDKLNPLHRQFTGSLNALIDSQLEQSAVHDKREILQKLIKLRQSWTNMILSLRSYFMTRAQPDYDELWSVVSLVETDVNELLAAREMLDFDTVFVDELASIAQLYLEKLPAVLNVYLTDQWRQDIYLARTRVYPITDSLRKLVRSLVENMRATNNHNAIKLSNELDALQVLSERILIITLVISLLVLYFVVRSVRRLLFPQKQPQDSVDQRLDIHRNS